MDDENKEPTTEEKLDVLKNEEKLNVLKIEEKLDVLKKRLAPHLIERGATNEVAHVVNELLDLLKANGS